MRVEGLTPGGKAVGCRAEVSPGGIGMSVGVDQPAAGLLDCRVPGRRQRYDFNRSLAILRVTTGTDEVTGPGCGDRRRNDERDTAGRAGLGRPPDGNLRLAHEPQGAGGIRGGLDHGPVDAIERVVADLGLACHEQRVGQQRPCLLPPASLDRDLSSSQQRKRLTGNRSDPTMQAGPLGKVAVGLVEPPGQDAGLAPQRERERLATCGAYSVRLCGELVGERDDLIVGQPP